MDLWSQRPEIGGIMQRGREQWAALRYVNGGRTERETILGEIAGTRELLKLGETLKSLPSPSAAAQVFARAWERDPTAPAALRNLVDATQTAGDVGGAEALRRRLLESRLNPGNDTTPRQFTLELADLLERRGAVEDAIKVIAGGLKKTPGDLELLMRQTQMLERMGRTENAEGMWTDLVHLDGGTTYSRNSLAVALEQMGRFAEAYDVRARAGVAGDAEVPVLLVKCGKILEALAAVEKLSGNNAVYAAMTTAEALALRGYTKVARSVLLVTATRISEARAQMQLCSKLLTIPGAPPTVEFARRMQERMKLQVLRDTSLAESYYTFFAHYAGRLGLAGAWGEEVRAAWQDGHGPLAAGEVLLRAQLSEKDVAAARRTTDRLLARPELNGERMERLSSLFAEAKLPAFRMLVLAANASRSWPYAEPSLEWARVLDEEGRREEAREVLGKYEWLAAFESGAESLGRAWLSLGDAERARVFFHMAFLDSRMEQSPAALGGLAQVDILAGRLPAAKLLLRRAFAVPACREYEALIAYVEASGDTSHWRAVIDSFELSAAAIYDFKTALFSHYEKQQRLTEALALVMAEPGLVVPSDEKSGGFVTCSRIRAMARKSGGFAEAGKVLSIFASAHLPTADAELAALNADAAEATGDAGNKLTHLSRAASLSPTRWEFTRRLAEACQALGDATKARTALERFLDVSLAPLEREAALELWEKVKTP